MIHVTLWGVNCQLDLMYNSLQQQSAVGEIHTVKNQNQKRFIYLFLNICYYIQIHFHICAPLPDRMFFCLLPCNSVFSLQPHKKNKKTEEIHSFPNQKHIEHDWPQSKLFPYLSASEILDDIDHQQPNHAQSFLNILSFGLHQQREIILFKLAKMQRESDHLVISVHTEQ